jgi:hypothetical protein
MRRLPADHNFADGDDDVENLGTTNTRRRGGLNCVQSIVSSWIRCFMTGHNVIIERFGGFGWELHN